MNETRSHRTRRILIAALGGLFLLGGCDPTIQQTVENGIISLSTGLLGSVFAAFLQAFQDSQSTAAALTSLPLA